MFLAKANILPIAWIKPTPNTLDSTVLTAMIGASKAHNIPPSIIPIPIIRAIAGCVSNNLAMKPANAVTTFNITLAIGAIAVPNATNTLTILPIRSIMTGPFSCTY